MKKILWGLLAVSSLSMAQNQDFKIRHQAFLNGKMQIIGNAIVGNGKVYNEITNKAKQNDEWHMKYINVDADQGRNFSSSSAFLQEENPQAKVKFAGLYWGATYPYEEGKNKGEKFVPTNATRNDFKSVRVKFPQQSTYETITGEVIFDENKENETDTSIYVMYADVTSLVKNLPSLQGEYVVANIRATQGKVSGGVAGGWSLVVVYETPNAPLQKFIIYDGFVSVNRQKKEIPFTGFKTPAQGVVKAQIVGSALEGDLNMSGDQIALTSEKATEFLHSQTRNQGNFFNSSITLNDTHNLNRNPNSSNTLGYDVFSLEFDSKQSGVITNNTSKLGLELTSKGDRYYLFMSGLAIETEPVLEQVQQEISIPTEIQSNENQLIEKEVSKNEAVKELNPELKKILSEVKFEKRISTNIEKGYYIISGVFAVKKNALRFLKKQFKKGFNTSSFFSLDKNYHYVYINKVDSLEEALKNKAILKELGVYAKEDLKNIWILSIDNQ